VRAISPLSLELCPPTYLLLSTENSNEIKDIHFTIADRLLLFNDSCY
jgi:hypothetical protein